MALALLTFEVQIALYVVITIAAIIATFFAVRSFSPTTLKHHIILMSFAGAFWLSSAFGGWYIAGSLTQIPTIQSSSPSSMVTLDPRTPDITIIFDRPVNFKNLDTHTFPDTDIIISTHGYFGNSKGFGRRMTITPKTSFPTGETVILYFSNVEGLFTKGFGGEHRLEFSAPILPEIESIDPVPENSEVGTTTPFTIRLTAPASYVSQWSATISPVHPIATALSSDGMNLIITPQGQYPQNHTFTVTLTQTPVVTRYLDKEIIKRLSPKIEKTFSFTTVHSPGITSFTPHGKSENPKNDIQIIFDRTMDTKSVESLLTVTPNTSRIYTWDTNNKTLTISHPDFPKDTPVEVKLPKGIKTANGGTLESEAIFEYKTAGPITIVNTSPNNTSNEIAIESPIRIVFDQPVDSSNIDKYFSITPPISVTQKLDRDTLELTPDAPLQYDTRYTILFSKGLPSEYGLPSAGDQTFSFVTTPHQISLTVPFFRQQTLFTCNIAAARMLLAYRGIQMNESEIVSVVGEQAPRTSGNPYKGYVPNYGTYWDALSAGIAKLRPIRMITSGKITDLVKEIKKGNPVMIWGQNGWSDPHEISWTAADGTYIKAVNGMHSSVVRGYRGPEDNPTHLVLNDPWRGQYALDTKEFMRRWSYFLMAMVVE